MDSGFEMGSQGNTDREDGLKAFLNPDIKIFTLISPCKDAADVRDEPLRGVESQNADSMETLQAQLQSGRTMYFNNTAAALCLGYLWPTYSSKSHSTFRA